MRKKCKIGLIMLTIFVTLFFCACSTGLIDDDMLADNDEVFDDGTISNTNTNDETVEENSKVTYKIHYNADGVLLSYITYMYDESGNCIEENKYDAEDNRLAKNRYSEQGDRDERFIYLDGDVCDYCYYEQVYNEQNKCIELSEYYGGILEYYWVYEYDENGKVVKETEYFANGVLTQYVEYKYNKDGNLTERICYDANGKQKKQYTYEYTYEQKLERVTFEYAERDVGDYQIIYIYDVKGNCINEVVYSTDGRLISYWIVKYDQFESMSENGIVQETEIIPEEVGYNLNYQDAYIIKERDKDNKLTKCLYYDDMSKLLGYSSYEYNENKCIESYSYIVCDEHGYAIKEIMYTYLGDVKGAGEYNKSGEKIKEVFYSDSGLVDYVVEYDEGTYTKTTYEYSIGKLNVLRVFNDKDKCVKAVYYADGIIEYYYEFAYNEYGKQVQSIKYAANGEVIMQYSNP